VASDDAPPQPRPQAPAPGPGATPPPDAGGTVLQGEESRVLAKKRSEEAVDLGDAGPVTETASQSKRIRAALLSKGRPHVPGYEVLRPLGAGTFGEVWLAQDEGTGVRVAVKFFAHGTGLQWQLLLAEVKQLAQLDSVHGIVQLKDVEPDATPPYYVMAYAEQGSLAERLEKGPLPLPEALALFRQVAEALAHVHAKGIRHCDLKPGNVLLDARGRALIGDFGQAHFSDDASPTLGTFFYMAPEQADLAGQIPDTRWDVYGLGALFYAMLTGRPPREDEAFRQRLADTAELSHRLQRYREWILKAPKPAEHRRLPGMDRDLADVLDRCLEIDPDKRLRDAGAVLAALGQRQRRRRQRPLVLFGLVAPLLMILATVGIVSWAVEDGLDAARRALAEQQKESDWASARLIAGAVEQELRERIELIEHEAGSANLARAMKDAGRREPAASSRDGTDPQLGALLRRLRAGREKKFVRWCLADRDGYVPAIDPVVPFPPNRYHWREWFNGEENKADKEGPGEPLRQPHHVSVPYLSTAADRLMMITISAPIPDPDGETRPVGVLMASFDPDTLRRWTETVETNGGAVVLLDGRGHCLLHPHKNLLLPRAEEDPRAWCPRSWLSAAPLYTELLAERQEGKGEYTDPVDGGNYLAGYAPLPEDLGWGVVVRHEREHVRQLQQGVVQSIRQSGVIAKIAIAVTVEGVLIAALWVWLWWMVRRTEDLAHG
jgi:eukaryotic-like serine/threonine-protein kinase